MSTTKFQKIIFSILVLIISAPFVAEGSGVDLTLYYGSRFVSMGGQQIAVANDGYAPFYNPAAMAFAPDNSVVINSTNLLYQFEAPIEGANLQRKSVLHHAPLFYVGSVYKLSDSVSVGLGVYPTALQAGTFKPVNYGTNTGKEWNLLLMRIEIAPSISFKFSEHISAGISYRPAFTQYDSQQGTNGVPFNPPTTFGDSVLDSSNSGWDGKGFKLGIHVADVKGFSGGLTYRPEVVTELSGDSTLTVAGTTATHASKRKIHVPSQLQLGIAYQWTPNFLTAVTYEFTGSAAIKSTGLKVPTLNALGSRTDEPLAWKDGHNIHIGSEYTWKFQQADHLRVGAGIVVDSSVTREGKPVPGVGPASEYVGYAIGSQLKCKQHEFGMALNYQQYEKRTTAVDSDVNPFAIFPGKYSLFVATLLADYQYHF